MTKTEKQKEYAKEWYKKNREKSLQSSKKNYRNNLEQKIEYGKQWRLDNKEKLKEYKKENYLKNKEKISQKHKEYYEKNKEKTKEKIKEYVKNNKEKIKIRINNRKKIDPLYKLRCNIRILILMSIKKQGYNKQTKTFDILGCTFEDFKQHIERQFLKGMSWDNRSEWHLDHIYPVSLAKDEAELIKLNHYTNFQPMWAAENRSKGNKIIGDTQIKLI
jgi:hypothetical protein